MFDEELITWSIDGGGNLFYRPRHKFSVTNVCGFMRIKTNKLHTPFVYYCLYNQHKKLTFDYTTKAHPSVIRKIYGLPKIEVGAQEKIANILQTIDQTITHTEALIEKYQQIKAGLMHDLFTRGIGADGKLRPSRDQAPELYQESSIGWIPKEWSLTNIDSIKESIVDGPFGSNLKTEHYVSEPGVRVVRLQNIQSTKYNDKDKAFVSNRHANSLLRNRVISNDILIAGLGEERYPVGRSCLYPEGLPPALNKADCFRLRCIEKEMTNDFAMYFLNTSIARTQVEKYNQGVTRSRINTGNIRKLTIPKPKLDEQFFICKRLNELARRIDVEIDVKHKLKKQKSGLMHDLLTGTVQVNIDPV